MPPNQNRRVGVSRLSIGFRHLMDWDRETTGSRLTDSAGQQGFSTTNSMLHYNLTGNIPGATKGGVGAATMAGGGMPRAENAIVSFLGQELPHFQARPEWFESYIRQMEYLIAEQGISGENSNPAVPTRRWIYGVPMGPSGGKRFEEHGMAGDAKQPVFERLLQGGGATGPGSSASRIYGLFYAHLARGMGILTDSELQNALKFLQDRDPALMEMGRSMVKGHLEDFGDWEEVETRVTEAIEAAGGSLSGASRQEIIAELTGMGLVVQTSHGQLGGSNPMDVLFNDPVTVSWPDPVNGPNEITMRLADITEEDWTKGGHHGTGKGTSGLTSAPAIRAYYNGGEGRIQQYNRIINLVRDFTLAMGGGTQTAGSIAAGETQDAWYRRRAAQIASNLIKHTNKSGQSPSARGSMDDLFIVLSQGVAAEEAWASSMDGAIEDITLKDLEFVLHHMGSANAIYEDARLDDNFTVNQYGELIAFDQGNDEEFTVIINFNVNSDGTIAQLGTNDVAVVQQSINDIFLSVWRGNLTNPQVDEAIQLAITTASMDEFGGYFVETAASGAPGRWVSFVARADATIPTQMDDMMYTFFNIGTAQMEMSMQQLLTDIAAEADAYSSTLRDSLSTELQNSWPSYAWGSRGQGNTDFGNWQQSPSIHSDRSHTSPTWVPTGLSMQNVHGIDFGAGRRFFPQFGDDSTLWPFQNNEQYSTEHGFGLDSWPADRAAAGHEGKMPNRKRVQPVMGSTDFNEFTPPSEENKRTGDWSDLWSRDGTSQPPDPDPLEFVWAAPYVVWQHYQRSGSQ